MVTMRPSDLGKVASGAVGRRFTAILAAEWLGVLRRNWTSERPLVFAHVVLTKTFGVRKSNEILVWITRWVDLWERGIPVGLVGGDEEEEASRESRAVSGREEEYEAVSRIYHDTVMSGKLRLVVRWATNRKGGGCLLSDDQCKKNG